MTTSECRATLVFPRLGGGQDKRDFRSDLDNGLVFQCLVQLRSSAQHALGFELPYMAVFFLIWCSVQQRSIALDGQRFRVL